jgi:hypothetical protein
MGKCVIAYIGISICRCTQTKKQVEFGLNHISEHKTQKILPARLYSNLCYSTMPHNFSSPPGIFFVACCILSFWSDNLGFKAILWAFFLGVGGIVFSFWLLAWIYTFDEGTDRMQAISDAISEGAEGYFAMQYDAIKKVTYGTAFCLFCMYAFREQGSGPIGSFTMACVTALTFLMGVGRTIR